MSEQLEASPELSPLQKQEREYDKELVHEVLINGSFNADHLRKLKSLFREVLYKGPSYGSDGGATEAYVNKPNRELLASHGLMDQFDTFLAAIDQAIESEIDTNVNDLNNTVFSAAQFITMITIDDVLHTVEKVVAYDGRVVPVIDGEPYIGEFGDLSFKDVES